MLLSRESQNVRRALTGERLRQFDVKRRFEIFILLVAGVFGLMVLVVLPLLGVDIHKSGPLKIGFGFVMAIIVGVSAYSHSYYPSNATLLLKEREKSDKKHD